VIITILQLKVLKIRKKFFAARINSYRLQFDLLHIKINLEIPEKSVFHLVNFSNMIPDE